MNFQSRKYDKELQKAHEMSTFILQSLFLIGGAYLLGAVVGCWIRKMFTSSASMLHRVSGEQGVEPALASAGIGAAAAVGATRYAGEEGEASIEIKRPDMRKEVIIETPVPVVPVVDIVVARETISYVEPEPAVTIQEPVVIVSETPSPPPVEPKEGDDLTKIKGVGLPVALELRKSGISRFEQVASWSDEDIADISEKLGFSGRIERENWMAQAQILATGDELEFTTHQLKQPEQNSSSRDIGKLISAANRDSAVRVDGDDLKRIVGIGSAIEAQLNQIGVTRFSQIAGWNVDEVTAIGRRLGLEDRIERENWVLQARNLDTNNI